MRRFRRHIAGLMVAVLLCLQATTAAAAGMTILRDDEIESSLRAMSDPVLKQAGLVPESVNFVIIDNTELNAFVAGGQNIFLYSGLILQTSTPDELIGVVAHETGHISGGHLFRSQEVMAGLSMQAMLSMVVGLAVAVAAGAPDAGLGAASLGNTIAERQFLRHSRTQEGAADQAGVRFLQGAGLPVTGFLSFMKKLETQELLPESQQSQYVLTHPLSQDRVEALQFAVDNGPAGATPSDWSKLHQRIKAKLVGYLFPDRVLRQPVPAADDRDGNYARAIALFRKGQPDASLAMIDDLLKAEPKNAYFYELKGQVSLNAGRVEQAIAAYARAVELNPDSSLIRIAYAHSLTEAKKDSPARLREAIKQLNRAMTREKYSSDPHYLLAIAYGRLGEEGMSRLHLAEEAMMQNRLDVARREAQLAKAQLKVGTPAYLRAEDILNALPDAAPVRKKRG